MACAFCCHPTVVMATPRMVKRKDLQLIDMEKARPQSHQLPSTCQVVRDAKRQCSVEKAPEYAVACVHAGRVNTQKMVWRTSQPLDNF